MTLISLFFFTVQEIFNIFDEDKDGKIAMSELKDMLYVLCNMEDDKKAQELIKKFDGDGKC